MIKGFGSFGVREQRVLLFLTLFAFIFIRYCYFGLNYYHQLDDYIQYHNYARGGDPLGTITGLGLLAARPLAGCADILVWSRFFDRMLIAVAALSALYAASALLLHYVWQNRFGTGFIFPAVFTLLPLGIEGTYWVSASSRIVSGLFFASLALYFFERWCVTGKRSKLIPYSISQLLCGGFYEQALIFSFTSVLILAAIHYRTDISAAGRTGERVRPRNRRALWGLLSVPNAAVYFIFTNFFKDSAVYGNRLGIITQYGRYYWSVTFPNIRAQVWDASIEGGFYTLVKGAVRGMRIILADGAVLYVIAVILLCAALFTLTHKTDTGEGAPDTRPCAQNGKCTAFLTGILLAAAPVTIFFVLESAWFSLRCTVMSFCGIALLADTFVILLSERIRQRGKSAMVAALTACFAFMCSIASVSEISDYRDTTKNDRMFIEELALRLESDGRISPELKIAVLNVEASYLPNQNYYYHEHIHGVTESAWAATGALEWRLGPLRPAVTPLPSDPMYRPWNRGASQLRDFDAVYIYLDGELIEAYAKNTRANDYEIISPGGSYIGRVWEEDDYGYLTLSMSSAAEHGG